MYVEAVRLQDEVRANLGARRARPASVGVAPGSRHGSGVRARLEALVLGVADELAQHLPELEHQERADQAMMNVQFRASSLSDDTRPAAPAREPTARPSWRRLARPGGADRWTLARDALVDWLSDHHPAFEASLRPSPVEVRAGDYLPDAVCRIGGEGTYLRHVLREPRATLLLAAGDEPTPAVVDRLDAIAARVTDLDEWLRVLHLFPSEGWADRLGHPHQRADVLVDGLFEVRRVLQLTGPELVFLRPDGYIGLRTTSLDAVTVEGYLRRVFRPDLLPT
jgi:hypothetical protein